MDFMRLMPFVSLFAKPAHEIPDSEIAQIAKHVAEDNAEELYPLLIELRDGSDKGTTIAKVLGTPVAKKILARMKQQQEEANSTVFCKCPECGTAFETDLS